MNQSYLDAQTFRKHFNARQSYIEKDDSDEIILDYKSLPEEYRVFPGLSSFDCSRCEPEQKDLLEEIINQVSNALKTVYYQYGIIKILPKFEISFDSDDAVILNWPYAVYRIYFDIESEVKNSFYGIVIRDFNNSIQTKTESISKENCASIVRQIIQYVFNRT